MNIYWIENQFYEQKRIFPGLMILFSGIARNSCRHFWIRPSLPVKRFKFRSLLGVHGHWSVRIFKNNVISVPHRLWHQTSVLRSYIQGPVTIKLFDSGTFNIYFDELGLSRPGFEHYTFCMRGERSILLFLRHSHALTSSLKFLHFVNSMFINTYAYFTLSCAYFKYGHLHCKNVADVSSTINPFHFAFKKIHVSLKV